MWLPARDPWRSLRGGQREFCAQRGFRAPLALGACALAHCCCRLRPGTPRTQARREAIETFSSASPFSPSVFLIALKAGGVGLNLTAASQVFLLEPHWNSAAEEQAMVSAGLACTQDAHARAHGACPDAAACRDEHSAPTCAGPSASYGPGQGCDRHPPGGHGHDRGAHTGARSSMLLNVHSSMLLNAFEHVERVVGRLERACPHALAHVRLPQASEVPLRLQ